MDTTYALDPASDLGGTLFAPPQWAAELGGCEQAEASDDFMSSLSNEVFGVKQESAFLDAEFEVGSGIPDYPSRPLFLDEDELSLASTSSNVSIDGELIADLHIAYCYSFHGSRLLPDLSVWLFLTYV